MPTPPITNVLPDPVLTALALELGMGDRPFIADLIAPPATVSNDSFKFGIFGREELNEAIRTERAPGTPASEMKLTQNFQADAVVYNSLKNSIPDEIMSNSPNPANLEGRRVRALTNRLMLGIERNVFNLVDAATNTETAPSVKWGTTATATVRLDILNAVETFRLNSGYYPNTLIIPPSVRPDFNNSTTIVDLLRFNQPQDLVASGNISVFEGMTVLYPGQIQNLENPGETVAFVDVWPKDEVYLLFVDATAGDDLGAVNALRQVRSTATTGQALSAYRWVDPDLSTHMSWVAVDINQKEVTVANDLILTILGVLA